MEAAIDVLCLDAERFQRTGAAQEKAHCPLLSNLTPAAIFQVQLLFKIPNLFQKITNHLHAI